MIASISATFASAAAFSAASKCISLQQGQTVQFSCGATIDGRAGGGMSGRQQAD